MVHWRGIGNRFFMVVITLCAIVNYAAAATPLMGWSSWNTFAQNINEANIKGQADAMVSKGLDTCGYKYINIDDGFFAGRYSDGSLRVDTVKFPSGFKALADYIHSKGLKAGFYSDAGSNLCLSLYNGLTVENGSGIYNHETQDANLVFSTWGYDYIKVDYCGGAVQGLNEQTRYTIIGNAIKATGRTGIIYNVCRWLFPGGWVANVASSWRIAADITSSWSSVLRIIDTNTYMSGFVSAGHYNDMDMLEVGNGSLTNNQCRSHFGMWCIMSSPLVLGNNIATMTDSIRAILTNKEVIAINQDTTALQAVLISQDSKGGQVWAKRLHGLNSNERAVALFNRDATSRTLSIRFKDIDLNGSATVRNLWTKTDLGSYDSVFSATVPALGIVLVKIVGTKSLLQEVFEAENSWMNNFKMMKSGSLVANQARPVKDTTCSRGAKAGYLGNNDSNFIEFHNIYANQAGIYHLTLCYQSGENRSATVRVNGHDTTITGLNSGSFSTIDSVTFPVSLQSGRNVIRILNASAYLPDIDKIRVDVNSGTSGIATPCFSDQCRLKIAIGGNRLTIQTDGEVLHVYIYDMAGHMSLSADRKVVSLKQLKPGAYLVKAITTKGPVVKTFIKM
jgi:hypothetical protein